MSNYQLYNNYYEVLLFHPALHTIYRCIYNSDACILDLAGSARLPGAVSIRKTVLPGMAIPMLKIRRPNGRLIFNMEIAIRR